MATKTKMNCPKCGFETTLVCVDGRWKCDFEKHGNRAVGKKCFNCQAPLGKGGQAEQAAGGNEDVPADEAAKLVAEIETRGKTIELLRKEKSKLVGQLESAKNEIDRANGEINRLKEAGPGDSPDGVNLEDMTIAEIEAWAETEHGIEVPAEHRTKAEKIEYINKKIAETE